MKTIFKTAITAMATMLIFAACGNAGAKTADRKDKDGKGGSRRMLQEILLMIFGTALRGKMCISCTFLIESFAYLFLTQ